MSRIKGRESLNRMPIIGKIKIGIKATNSQGKEYPTSIDYFRATGMYAPLFHKEFGDKPNKLSIVFPSNNLDDVCNQRFELRDKSGRLFAYSDGEQFHVYNSKEEDYEPEVPTDPNSYMEELRKKCEGKWDETLTMKFVLIELKGIHGVWQLSTKGKASSIPNLINIFDQVYGSAGMVQGVPFDLTIEKVKSQKPESKKNFPVLNIIPNVSTDNMQKLGEYLGHGETMKRLCVLTNDKIQEIISGDQKSLKSGTIDDIIDQPKSNKTRLDKVEFIKNKIMELCEYDPMRAKTKLQELSKFENLPGFKSTQQLLDEKIVSEKRLNVIYGKVKKL